MFFQIRSIKADVFSWLDQVQDSLENGQKQQSRSGQNEASDDEDEEQSDFGFFD